MSASFMFWDDSDSMSAMNLEAGQINMKKNVKSTALPKITVNYNHTNCSTKLLILTLQWQPVPFLKGTSYLADFQPCFACCHWLTTEC
jgi:hypothetical protein